jgi:class 3 adenylate cyclase
VTTARRAQARAYLPLGLAQRLSAAGEQEIEGECRFDGTALVADVAGYTRLAAAFTEQGEEGIERLSQTLGETLKIALDAVQAFGGEVVYFAGDAVVGYWAAEGGGPGSGSGEAPGRDADLATACAERMLRATAAAAAAGAPPLHVGLASGRLWAAKVGGWSGRWNLIFGGQATRAAFAASRRAASGEVWLDPSTRRRLDESAAARAPARVTGDQPLLELHADGGSEGRRHHHLLPPDIEERAEVDDGAWSAELRPIDCLFLRLPTLDEEADGALARFHKALFLAQDALGMASGTGRLVIDERGLTLVWVAGEPMAGHSRPPEASLSLAAQVFEVLRDAGLRPSAGFTSGRAFCATLGNDLRREPVVVGTPMILAARLMDLGLPQLAVSEVAALTAAPPGLVLAPDLQPVALKGFPRPLAIWRASRPAAMTSTLVGRDHEMAIVEHRLEALAGGRGGVMLITAAAGMGKSALMRAVRAACGRRGLRFGLGEAFGAERRVPYFPWRAIARSLFTGLRFDEPAALRDELALALARAGHDPALAPLLEVVFPAGAGETAETRPIVGEHRARATRDLLLALFQPLGKSPLVIAIEDLHHMDTPSLQLLELAIRRMPGALFVLTTRPQPLPDAGELVARASVRIDLGPLAAGDVARLARERLGLTLTDALAAEVCRRASGIPLYAFEYLRQAREALPEERRRQPLAELPAAIRESIAGAADPLRGVLMRSFEGLSAVENRLLKAASVLGERVGPALLQAAVVEPGEEALDIGVGLRRLVERGLLVTDDDADHQFAHALIQSSCYETIPVNLRRVLHGRIAGALEQRMEGASEGEMDEGLLSLTHHHHAAGNADKTVHFGERAAARARRHGAYREAMRLLDQCLEASKQLALPEGVADPRVRWRRLKAEAAGAVGDRETREREARAAIALVGVRSTRGRLLPALAGVARLLGRTVTRPRRLLLRQPGASEASEPGCSGPVRFPGDQPAGSAGHRELAQAHRQLAIGAYFSGDGAETAYNTTSALAHAARVGRSPELSDSLASVGTCLGLVGFPAPARRHLEAARLLAHDLGDEAAIAYAEVTTALFSVGVGDWEAVRAAAERCQMASRRTGDTGTWGYAEALRFWMFHYRGETEAAVECARALAAASSATGNLQHQSWAARFLALGCMRRHQWAEARQHLENARSLFSEAEKTRELRPLYELMPVLADLAATAHELGDGTGALAQADAALDELARARRPAGHALLEGCSALVHVYLSRPEAGDEPARRSLQVLARYCRIFPIGRPRLALWTGRRWLARDRRKRALATWRAGLDEARRLGMGHDERLLTSAIASA